MCTAIVVQLIFGIHEMLPTPLLTTASVYMYNTLTEMVRYCAEFPSVVSECSCDDDTLGGREGDTVLE